jgi:pimeloyl-ACP methyl ester carboxylesterase
VLIAPHVFVEPITLAGIAAARRAYDAGRLRAKLARHHRDVDNAFRGWNDAWLEPGFRDWRIDDRIGAIRVPMLLIQGDADTYGTAAQLDAIAKAAGAAVETMLVAGAGHAPQNSHQDAVLARIARFVARLIGGTDPS